MENARYQVGKIIAVYVGILLYSFFFIQYDYPLFRLTTAAAMLVLCSYLIIRIIYHYFVWYTSYMFNERVVGFDKKVERPRLYLYSVFFPIMATMVSVFMGKNYTGDIFSGVILSSLWLGVFIISFLIINLAWGNKFEDRFIPNVTKMIG